MNRRFLVGRIVLSAIAVILLPSCRKLTGLVREQRRPCPAWVSINAEPGVDPDSWSYVHLYLPHEEELEERKIRSDEFNLGQVIEWEKDSPFTAVILAGWSGEIKGPHRTASSLEDGLILIPEGKECPKAMGGSVRERLTEAELYAFPVPMRPLFATLLFSFNGEHPDGSEFLAEVSGTIDGYSVPGFKLHEGPFVCTAHSEGKDRMAARIPRQESRDGRSGVLNLIVTFYYRENASAPWARLVSVSLGSLLSHYHYDWTKDEPEPVRLDVTRSGAKVGKIEVSSGEWTTAIYAR